MSMLGPLSLHGWFVILMVVVAALTVLQFRFLERRVHYG